MEEMLEQFNFKNIKTIYCDFDGTITKKDAVNTFFELYADETWKDFEQLWIDGKISSRENAIKQVALLPELEEEVVDKYIDSIEIDEGFIDFVEFINSKNIELVILSDGFDLFIEKTLEKYNLRNIKFFANHLKYENNKFSIDFPYFNEDCVMGAGMCKCSHVKEKQFCYIGDGTSDLCVARKASALFASKNLATFCNKNDIKYIPFNSFCNIISFIQSNWEK